MGSRGGGGGVAVAPPTVPPTVSNPPLDDPFNGLLGPRMNRDSMQAIVDIHASNAVNPNYGKGDMRYHTNCALCATAVALQAMGYDVEAMPRDNTWRGQDSVFHIDTSNPDNYILNGGGNIYSGTPKSLMQALYQKHLFGTPVPSNIPTMPRGANAAANAIIQKVQGWGHGAVGMLSVSWQGMNSSHAINIFNNHGRVVIFDAQCNKMFTDIPRYLSRTVANNTMLLRLDNASVRHNINASDLQKMVKVR